MNDAARLPGMPTPRPADETVLELLAVGARSDNLHMLRAHRELSRALARGHDAVTSGAFSAWLQLWRQGIHSAFVVDPADQQTYQRLARAGLRLDHQLAGPDHRTAGPAVAVGDQLTLTTTIQLGCTIFERGALLEVTAFDAGTVRLSAPVDGVLEQVGVSEPGWRQVDHGYADISLPRHGREVAPGLTW